MSSSRIVVVGCGRVGSLCATMLSGRGHPVVVVDRKDSAFETLGAEFSGFQIQGNASEMEVLRSAVGEGADVLLAATDSDTLNLMVAQVAREALGVRRVVARVFLPEWEEAYQEFGIETVSPVRLAVEAFLGRARVPKSGTA